MDTEEQHLATTDAAKKGTKQNYWCEDNLMWYRKTAEGGFTKRPMVNKAGNSIVRTLSSLTGEECKQFALDWSNKEIKFHKLFQKWWNKGLNASKVYTLKRKLVTGGSNWRDDNGNGIKIGNLLDRRKPKARKIYGKTKPSAAKAKSLDTSQFTFL